MTKFTITLRPVTRDNWIECINLETHDHQQGFVSPNVFSIAQSKFEPQRKPHAIYNEQDEIVGFVLYNDEPLDDGTYRLSRLMIDKRFQGRGYGRAAAIEVIERLKKVPDCYEIVLDFKEINETAAKLWTSLGFEVFDRRRQNLVAKLVIRH